MATLPTTTGSRTGPAATTEMSSPETRPSVRARALSDVAVIAAFALFAIVQTGSYSAPLQSAMYGGGGGDPGQDAWILWWVSGHLSEPSKLFEGNVYYPAHYSVLFCDPLVGPALLVAPLRMFTNNPILLYNVAELLVLIVASYGFYLLALALFHERWSAVLAGIVIPFTSQQMSRLVHLNLLTLTFYPFLLLGLLRSLAAARWMWAVVAGAAFALQGSTSGYHAIAAAFLATTVVATHWRSLASVGVRGRLLVAAATASLLLLPYVLGFWYLGHTEAVMLRDAAVQRHYSLDLPLGFLSCTSYVWRSLLGTGGSPPFFPGAIVAVFATLAVARRPWSATTRLWVAMVVVFAALAAGPVVKSFGVTIGPGPFRLAAAVVPFMGAVRHPMTFGVLAVVGLGMLAVEGASRCASMRAPGARALVVACAAAELLQAPPRRYAPPTTPGIYDALAQLPPGALLEVPFGQRPDPEIPSPDSMSRWYSIAHRRNIVNGTGAFEPERFITLSQLANHEWKRGANLEGTRSLEYLLRWFPIRYLLVHRTDTSPEMRAAIAVTPAFRLAAETTNGDRIYEVDRSAAGEEVVRAFRDDEMKAEASRWRIRSLGSARRARVEINGHVVAMVDLQQAGGTSPLVVGDNTVQQHGLNMVSVVGLNHLGRAEIELRRIP